MKRLILGLVTATLTATAAASDTICMKTADLEAGLIDWYGEVPVRQISGTAMLWKSELAGTWSIVEKRMNGISCTIETGDRTNPQALSDELTASLD